MADRCDSLVSVHHSVPCHGHGRPQTEPVRGRPGGTAARGPKQPLQPVFGAGATWQCAAGQHGLALPQWRPGQSLSLGLRLSTATVQSPGQDDDESDPAWPTGTEAEQWLRHWLVTAPDQLEDRDLKPETGFPPAGRRGASHESDRDRSEPGVPGQSLSLRGPGPRLPAPAA